MTYLTDDRLYKNDNMTILSPKYATFLNLVIINEFWCSKYDLYITVCNSALV